MKPPIRIAVTGATGQICYNLLFRIAAGDMLGKDQPVILQLFDIRESMTMFDGIAMELLDCAFPLLVDTIITDDLKIAFRDVDIAILVGARPRTKNMQRKDLLAANGPIFAEQGKMLDAVAKRNVKVLIVGNPANTNTYIAMKNAPGLNTKNFTAMLRLDHNRALSQVAQKINRPISTIRKLIIWGNHSDRQYPDISYAFSGDEKVTSLIDDKAWAEDYFIPTVQNRGATIIAARSGKSSAASAASAIINHIRDWLFCTKENDWVSVGIPSNGSYGIPEGVIYGFPVTCRNGEYQIVQHLKVDDFSKKKMQGSYQELLEERDAVSNLVTEVSRY